MKEPVTPEHAARARKLADQIIEPLRAVAREHGYALGVHGSLARDIDLIAAPWSLEISPPPVLAEALRAKAEEINGFALNKDAVGSNNPSYFHRGSPGHKPHGRLCWTFWLNGQVYIDLSVMTPASVPDYFGVRCKHPRAAVVTPPDGDAPYRHCFDCGLQLGKVKP